MFKYTFWVAFLRQIIHNWTVFPFKDSFNVQRARTSVWFMLEKNISQKAIEFYLDGDRCSQQFGCWNKGRLVLKKKKKYNLEGLRAYFNSISSVDYISWTSLESIFYLSFTTTILVAMAPPQSILHIVVSLISPAPNLITAKLR